ncbi:hypothetical protein [Streptomyces palmae]|uniref:Prenyltransferase n=1 Tax=Streptomyces palmae TaxID=1701085 RepID=A0A4Z0H8M8_9ACTN|nr:hypothetical protein [Streptomyces palmae]TGB13046.1 hypothetical protein E4099_10695 [Streptomyces palmae]
MDRSEAASSPPLARAERFVWLTARVLEQHRFAYHFLGGAADAVDAALTAYERPDGGFGHALEPELRGPVSQPWHVVRALHLLAETGHCQGRRVERICRYLTGVSTSDGALPALHPSLRGYPVAPWLSLRDHPPSDLLTTGPVVGLLHRSQVWHAWLFRATDFCWASVGALADGAKADPREVAAAVAFLDGAPDRPRAEQLAERLGRSVRERRLVRLDPGRPAEGGPKEPRLPLYEIARTPASLARRWFTDAEVDRALDFLAAAQRPDGGWPAPAPGLGEAPGTGTGWTPAIELESRPIATVDALLTLRAYGRPVA